MDISPKALLEAIDQIAYERKIPAARILETVEAALAAAYRKDFGHPEQQVRAKLNADSGKTDVSIVYNIVEEVENPQTEMTVAEAKKKGMKTPKVGDEYIEEVSPPADYGRIAAQTAKQVIIQRIREVERELVQEEFADHVGELMTGAVQRVEGRNVFVEVGRALGVLSGYDQIQHERYYIGQRLRVLLKELDSEGRGAQLILTRSHPDFVRRLFELEVPEIHAGTVEIKSIAREAGVRTKVAVHSNQEGVDPVGTCVGQRGTRVQAIMAELGEEKIDIVLYDEDAKTFITNALSPAKISNITLHEDTKTADIEVADDQLSLAIGRGGQNVRLAGELTGWQLDIEKNEDDSGQVAGTPLEALEGLEETEVQALSAAGLETVQAVAKATDKKLEKVEGVELPRLQAIKALASEHSQPATEEAVENTAEPGDATEEAAAEKAEEKPTEQDQSASSDEKAEVTEEPAATPAEEKPAQEASESPDTETPQEPPADATPEKANPGEDSSTEETPPEDTSEEAAEPKGNSDEASKDAK